MKEIHGYYEAGGGCLVTIDGAPLGLPDLRRDEARHSPDGFQWSYGGSGPAELARALLMAICRDDLELARHPGCYQRFKFDVIAALPKAEFKMPSTLVEEWMANFKAGELGRSIIERMRAIERIEEDEP